MKKTCRKCTAVSTTAAREGVEALLNYVEVKNRTEQMIWVVVSCDVSLGELAASHSGLKCPLRLVGNGCNQTAGLCWPMLIVVWRPCAYCRVSFPTFPVETLSAMAEQMIPSQDLVHYGVPHSLKSPFCELAL